VSNVIMCCPGHRNVTDADATMYC